MTGCRTEKSLDTPCHSTYAGVSYCAHTEGTAQQAPAARMYTEMRDSR